MLVIVHHASITYGAGGSWYFEDVDKTQMTVSIVLLTLFTAVNQSFFMGLFFFLSGYFTPGSYDRKSPGKFLADRFIRLGIPLVAFMFLLGPFTTFLAGHGGDRSFGEFYRDEVLSFRTFHFGPLWFVEALLYFAILYVIWRSLTRSRAAAKPVPFPSMRTIWITAAALGLAAFLVRLAYPTGSEFLGLQLGYFPSYIVLFIAGIVAKRSGWLERIPAATVRAWSRISLIAFPVLPAALILTGALDGNLEFAGGINVQAFVYAMWEPFVGLGIIFFLLKRFAERHNTTSPLKQTLSNTAFTAYIIHPVIIVAISLAFVGLPLYPTLKFIIVAALSVVACFAASWAIRKIPYADRVL